MRQVLLQNTGAVDDSTTFADPSAVTAGKLAAFNALTGAGVALDSAMPNEIILVQGHASDPILTNRLKKSDITAVYKKTFEAPVKWSVVLSAIPTGSAGDFVFKLVDLTPGTEPYPRWNAEAKVLAGDSAAAIINKLVDAINALADFNYINNAGPNFSARSNAQVASVITGTSGTANFTIDSVDYLATFDTDLDTTGANFVTAHATAILSAHKITVTYDAGSDSLIFTDAGNGTLPTIVSTNASGNLDGAETLTAATTMTVEANNFWEFFEIALDGGLEGATTTVTPYKEGSGRYEQVLDLEKDGFGNLSRYYQDDPVLGRQEDPETYAVVGNQYDLYTILHKTPFERSINKSVEHQEITLAVEDSVNGDLDTFFTGLLA